MRRAHAWYSALVIAAAAAASAVAYPRLTERVPVHWNLRGEADRFGTRVEGAWLVPAVMVAVWLVMRLLPKIDPREPSYAKMRSTYDFLVNAILTLMFVLHIVALAMGLGYEVSMRRVAPLLMGAFFVAFGNVLPRMRPNWWLGIRTPWTLSSDRVWARTHRVGGYAMTATGLALLAAAALPGAWPLTTALVLAALAVFALVVYSYVAWRQEKGS